MFFFTRGSPIEVALQDLIVMFVDRELSFLGSLILVAFADSLVH